MPGPRRATIEIAVFGRTLQPFTARGTGNVATAGRKRCEDRREVLDNRFRTADHQAVSPFRSPDAAAGADIYVMNAFFLQCPGTPYVIFKIGVPAVDKDVARFQSLRERLHGLLGGLTCRHHNPCRPRL